MSIATLLVQRFAMPLKVSAVGRLLQQPLVLGAAVLASLVARGDLFPTLPVPTPTQLFVSVVSSSVAIARDSRAIGSKGLSLRGCTERLSLSSEYHLISRRVSSAAPVSLALLLWLTVRHASAGGVFDQTRSRNNLSARAKRACTSMSIIYRILACLVLLSTKSLP